MGFLVAHQKGAGASWPSIAVGLFAAFGGILYGYDTGTISGILAMKYWLKEFSTGHVDSHGNPAITSDQESTIVSILSAGTFFGALASPLLSDRIGRRYALCLVTWVFNLGVALQTAATAQPMFIAGRFFAGLGVGLISAIIPLYQSETAPKWIRGLIVGSYQLAITIGLLLANVVNNATHKRDDSGSYRIPIAVQFAWSLILFGGMLFLPETPRFLVKQGKDDAAAKALSRLRRLDQDHQEIRDELAEIRANHEYEMSLRSESSTFDALKPPMLRRLLTGVGIQALQQLTGVNFIFYYGTKYFENSGMKNAFVISMITSSINVVSTFPGIWATDKFGRRPLLLAGAIGMAVSQLIVGLTGTLSTDQTNLGVTIVKNEAAQRAGIAFICIYIFFFASTWGPLAWVVCSEIFPLRIRAFSVATTTASNWLLNWAIAYSTPYLVNWGPGNANLQSKIFFIWFGACFLCIAFVYFFVYETKNLTLEEVDELYAEVPHAWKSAGWKPTLRYADTKLPDPDKPEQQGEHVEAAEKSV
ncbi:hypothetical protein TD95_005002 [Thielaviopsis punctulata]|uniref:Major facilitator superfamily (MFS) profile domain-containing protein n=1 Tax=Thielaviopsis punctulata TaxID=72032 RepID=A0A0F4Z9V5_9PEZI|nr:hypothetical protein TD95_005002 [Thielaviopsis punctulata]